MTDLSALIERLEAAPEGSRELDAEIKGAIDGADEVIRCDDTFTFFEARKNGEQLWLLSSEDIPHYTTSLDAALPWENITEAAVYDIVEGEPLGDVWEAWHFDKETGNRCIGKGYTETLARRAAALRARGET